MADPIRILVVDDAQETRDSVKKLLQFEEDIEVVGEGSNGVEGVQLANSLKPDVILMDINMPEMDGIKAAEQITLDIPSVGIIMLSVQGDQEYLRKAMSAGAREYLTKPFSIDELVNAIRRVKDFVDKRKVVVAEPKDAAKREKGKVIAIFGTKGGVGKSLVAANLAVSLASEHADKVCILDLDLQFGDISSMLNAEAKLTIADAAQSVEKLDIESLDSHFVKHTSTLKILAAPSKPAYADVVTPESIEKIVLMLKEKYAFILADTHTYFDDVTLKGLDLADLILCVVTLDFPAIKNAKLALDTMMSLNYPKDKIKLVLNRADSQTGLKEKDLEDTLGWKIEFRLPSDGKLVVPSVNKGVPFVTSDPGSNIAKAVKAMCDNVMGGSGEEKAEEKDDGKKKKRSLFSRK